MTPIFEALIEFTYEFPNKNIKVVPPLSSYVNHFLTRVASEDRQPAPGVYFWFKSHIQNPTKVEVYALGLKPTGDPDRVRSFDLSHPQSIDEIRAFIFEIYDLIPTATKKGKPKTGSKNAADHSAWNVPKSPGRCHRR
jgi:hypothetical protein